MPSGVTAGGAGCHAEGGGERAELRGASGAQEDIHEEGGEGEESGRGEGGGERGGARDGCVVFVAACSMMVVYVCVYVSR